MKINWILRLKEKQISVCLGANIFRRTHHPMRKNFSLLHSYFLTNSIFVESVKRVVLLTHQCVRLLCRQTFTIKKKQPTPNGAIVFDVFFASVFGAQKIWNTENIQHLNTLSLRGKKLNGTIRYKNVEICDILILIDWK